MTDMRFPAILVLPILLAALALGPAGASASDMDEPPILLAQGNGGKSLSEAVEQVRRQTGGRILSAETRVKNGREVHHIKVLTKDGKVKTHKVQGRRQRG